MEINNIIKAIVITAILSVVSCETSAEQYTECSSSSTCKQHELCKGYRCVNVCTFTNDLVAKNALCTASDHVPKWSCPEGYGGNPLTTCTKTCIKDKDCATMDVCMHGDCTPGCNTIACRRNQHCFTLNNFAECV